MSTPEGKNPFREVHSELASVFGTAHPIDIRIPRTRELVQKSIPDTIDTILLLHGAEEEKATAPDGFIGLFPGPAEDLMKMSDPATLEKFNEDLLLFRELTGSDYLPVSHMRLSEYKGILQDFSLVFMNPVSSKRKIFELVGVFDDGSADDKFEFIAQSPADKTPSKPHPLHEDVAGALINIACLFHGVEDTSSSLQERIRLLADNSPEITHQRHAEYLGESESLVELKRSDLVTHTIGERAVKLAHYYAIMRKTERLNGGAAEATSSVSLLYDITDKPRYKAHLDMFVNDPHRTLDRDQRRQFFHEPFMHYRDNPEDFFEQIAAKLEEIAALEL